MSASLTLVVFLQEPSRSDWSGNVKRSTDETGLVSHQGCPQSGSPHCSSSSWASSPSQSPVDCWWHHTGAEKPPNMPAGSPSLAVSEHFP